MNVHIIVAVDRNGVFAVDGKIPWHCPEDLQHFKDTTINLGRPDNSYPQNAVIMGRKTQESIGQSLSNRVNLVVSSSTGIPSLEHALNQARQYGCPNAFIIGGYNLFYEAMQIADTLYLSVMRESFYNKNASIHQIFPFLSELNSLYSDSFLGGRVVEIPPDREMVIANFDLSLIKEAILPHNRRL